MRLSIKRIAALLLEFICILVVVFLLAAAPGLLTSNESTIALTSYQERITGK